MQLIGSPRSSLDNSIYYCDIIAQDLLHRQKQQELAKFIMKFYKYIDILIMGL